MNQTQFQKAAGISAGLAARWFPHITAAMKEFGITSAIDQAMFIAQCGHESTGLTGWWRISTTASPGLLILFVTAG
jgi:putative chitinase